MNVIKRDGTQVPFDKQKIINAITKANNEVDFNQLTEKRILEIANEVENFYIDMKSTPSVEEIQDFIEEILMSFEAYDVAKCYVKYRFKRQVARDQHKIFMDAITEKLEARNVANQNANVDEKSFGGRTGEASSVMTRQYALDYLISPMAKTNHLNNRIYIHDLDAYAVGSHNCLTIPFDKLLAKGFNTRQTDVRPAQSVSTAFQLVAVIFQLQSLQQFGGVSASHIDWTMVPYVRKSFYKHLMDGYRYLEGVTQPEKYLYQETAEDFWSQYDGIEDKDLKECHPRAYKYALEMTEREARQAAEGMYHNLNTLQSRSGNQLPFTSINYGTCTLPEGRMITRALLEASINGVGKFHKTSIFPCGIFQCMKGVNRKQGDPNYDLFKLALKSTAQRLYPNYCNVDWSGNIGYDINDPKTYMSTINRTVA